MPSELNVEVLFDEGQIKIRTNNYEQFLKYTTNGQKDKEIKTTFCMLDNKLLRIQVNGASSQESNINQLVVKSVSTINGDTGWEEKEITTLFGLSEAEKNKTIEIFKSFGPKIERLANEKEGLKTQLDTANTAKTTLEKQLKELETAQKEAEQEATNLQTKFDTVEQEKQDLQTKLDEAEQKKNEALEAKIQELEAANQKAQKLESEKAALQTQLTQAQKGESELESQQPVNAEVERLRTKLDAANQKVKQLESEKTALENKKSTDDAQVTTLTEKNKELAAKQKEVDAKVKQLESEKAALEAKKQPTEQSKAPTYTAAVGMGLAAGLVAFIALERTVRLDIWVTVGIALASALAASGATYLALKPSTQVNEAETQGVNKEALKKQPA